MLLKMMFSILITGFTFQKTFAISSCEPITAVPVVNCTEACTMPSSSQNLNINAGEIICIPQGSSQNFTNITINGGELRICGELTVNTFNTNGLINNQIKISESGFLTVNNDMNLTSTMVSNFGKIEVKGDKIQMNSSENTFINFETGLVKMSKNSPSTEMIINSSTNSSTLNQFYNYGKIFLQKIRANNSTKARFCLDNSDVKYQFCVLNGMELDPKTPFQVIDGTLVNISSPNLIDTTGFHQFQNFFNNGIPTQKLFSSPQGYSGKMVYYQGSSTNPTNADPGSQNFTPDFYENITASLNSSVLKCETSLPVELSSFGADLNKELKKVRLNWTTQTEKNNDFFEVYRGVDQSKAIKIGEVDGAGDSNALVEYQFIDENLPVGSVLYYHLKQVDIDGKSENSRIVPVDNSITTTVKMFPTVLSSNSSVLNIDFITENNQNVDVQLMFINNAGNIVNKQKINIRSETFLLNYDELNLARGLYYIHIIDLKNNKKISHQKIIIN